MRRRNLLVAIAVGLAVGVAFIAADPSYTTGFYVEQGGDRAVVASGGSLDVESGGVMDVESGGSLKIAGTAVTSSAAELNLVDGSVAGTAVASKALVLGASKEAVGLGSVTLDVGSGASPSVTFTDGSDETAVFNKADSGDLSCTIGTTDSLKVATGNLKVGDGSPSVTMDGEDAYVEGTFEADGAARFDGAVTANAGLTVAAGETVNLLGYTIVVGTAEVDDGQTAETVTVAGTDADDLVFATMVENPTNGVYIKSAVPGTNQVVLTMSGDPGTTTTFAYQVWQD